MFSKALVAVALGASALANVYITSPVLDATFTAGTQATVSWIDDGKAPSLAQFGPAKVSIYAGNALQQTQLQAIANVDVSKNSSVTFTPDPTIGPNAEQYFIRIESVSLMSGQYPAMAFSAKFSLAGMTGTFTPAVQSQIDGQSTAPIAGPTSSGAATSAASTKMVVSTVTTGSKTSATPSATGKSNGAMRTAAGGVAALAGFVAYALL